MARLLAHAKGTYGGLRDWALGPGGVSPATVAALEQRLLEAG
jgi:hypothetical protein